MKENSTDSQSKASGKTSRLGRFGFGSGLFQKTVGMVLKPRQDKQVPFIVHTGGEMGGLDLLVKQV